MPADTPTRPAADPAYPPCSIADIASYDMDDVTAGYCEFDADDPEPGGNRSPSYRWGWTNRRRDHFHVDDGFDGLRFAFVRAERAKAAALLAIADARANGEAGHG